MHQIQRLYEGVKMSKQRRKEVIPIRWFSHATVSLAAPALSLSFPPHTPSQGYPRYRLYGAVKSQDEQEEKKENIPTPACRRPSICKERP